MSISTTNKQQDAYEAHEVFDAEPVRELGEGEPNTPLWLPAVGVALFVLVGIYLMVGSEDETSSAAATAGGASASAKVTAAQAGKPPVAPSSDPIRSGRKYRLMPGAKSSLPPVRPARPPVK